MPQLARFYVAGHGAPRLLARRLGTITGTISPTPHPALGAPNAKIAVGSATALLMKQLRTIPGTFSATGALAWSIAVSL